MRAVRLAATEPGVGGELFQIATNSETSVNELVDALVPVLREAGIQDVEVTNTELKVGDVRRNYSDTYKAQSMLGWKAEVSLAEGLRRTVGDLVQDAELKTEE